MTYHPDQTPVERTQAVMERSWERVDEMERKERVCPADDPVDMEHYFVAGELGRLAAELIDWQRYMKDRATGNTFLRDHAPTKALCGTFAKRLGGWIAEVLAARERHERWREINREVRAE